MSAMHNINVNAYTPQQTIELVGRAGVSKGNTRLDKVFLSAVSAGCLLSVASAVTLTMNTAPWFQENAPGMIRVLGAIVFPFGLCMIVLTGADLCTGSFLFTTVAVLQKRLSIVKMLTHWFITFWGNLAGALFIVSIIFGYGNVFSTAPYLNEIHTFVTTKQLTPHFHNIFLRGIGCNWLVCLGCFFGFQARDLASKVIGIWFPIFAFVALGFDHVVANMFFVPMGIWLKTPHVTVGLYIWKGIIPAFLGNLVGGVLFCGGYYWWMYLAFQPEIAVDGVMFEPSQAPVSHGISMFKRKNSDEESATGEEAAKKGEHAS